MVQDLVPAALERFGDAQAALISGSPTGSVYLAGYSVEMVLKHAAFRVDGLQPYDYVRDALAPARSRLKIWLGRPIEHDSYHSLKFWALLLRETHLHRRGAVPSKVSSIVQAACLLHECWQVALRYRSAMISLPDAQSFLRNAGRFPAKSDELWR